MLKILVVEDNQEKLRHVTSILQEVPGCVMEQIDIAHDGIEAKRKLRSDQYDLLILDIALPGCADQIPSPDGGITLLEEVLSRDLYNRPREVVGLTAFADVRERVGPRFEQDLWDVILYDPSSDAWSQQLKRKVRHLQMVSRFERKPEHGADLCVVTALPEPELSAVLALAWNWQAHEVPGDGTVYHKGSYVNALRQTCTVIASAAPRMGMTAAAVWASKMIHNFRPRYIAMTGIAAGIKGACELGDIIAADPVWDWGSGKRYVEGGSPIFSAAPHQIGLSSFVRGKLSAMAQNAALFHEIRESWHGPKPKTVVTLRLGPVASGASVLADGSIIETIRQQHRKVIGVEMELYGLMGAVDEAPIPTPKAIGLKSVCDFADENKNDEYQAYAAYTSAAALRALMERYLD